MSPFAKAASGAVTNPPPPDEEIVLASGEHLTIRAVGRGDVELERRFIEALSPASGRFRFLDTMRTPSDALLKQLTVLDPAKAVAFVAVVREGREETAVGVGRFSAEVDGHDCEFALAVAAPGARGCTCNRSNTTWLTYSNVRSRMAGWTAASI